MKSKLMKWSALIGRAVLCGVGGLQILYALRWAWENGSNIQDFYDSGIYLGNALTMCSDGWHLVGYSCLLKIFMLFEGALGNGYIILLYIFQAITSLLCFAAGYQSISRHLFDCTISYSKAILPAIYILTLPVIWQMQFAVLPDALCLSLIVLVMAKLLENIAETKKINIYSYLVILGSGLLMGVLKYHYFYGFIFLLIFYVCIMIFKVLTSKKKMRLYINKIIALVIILVMLPITVNGINKSVPETNNYTSYSICAELISRFVYPNIGEDYQYYSEEIKEALPQEKVMNPIIYYETYYEEFGVLIQNVEKENGCKLFFEMAKTGFEQHTESFIKGTIKEVILYTFAPLSIVKNMYNNGNSLYGHNYTKMYEMSPGLTADYMHIGMNGLLLTCLIGILIVLLEIIFGRQYLRRNIVIIIFMFLNIWSITFFMMLFSIMKFDYRIGLFSVFIWAVTSLIYINDIGKELNGLRSK